MRRTKILLTMGFVFAAFFALAGVGAAENFPDKPITLVVPYPAGGATDVVIRPLAEAVKGILGQPVIVENRGGGGGAVGVGYVVSKAPDGYYLAVVVTSQHRVSFINKLSFDTVKDVTPIIRIGGYLYGILVKPDSRYKSLKDLIEYAKTKPGQVSYMASGIGTGGHIAAEEMATNAGVKFNHLPSKGDQESSANLLGGHIDFISTTSGWIPLVEAGKLKLLATYNDRRIKRFPDVPTVKELGYGVIHNSPIGIVGPKGLAADRVKLLHDAFHKAMNDPAFLAAMGRYEMPLLYQNTADFTKFWAEAYQEAGVQVKRYIKK